MANAISGALHAQQVAQASQVQSSQPKPASKQEATKSAAPEDTVTISSAARAASHAAQNQQTESDGEHDGK